MVKRLITLMLALACSLLLAACSSATQAAKTGLDVAYEKLCATDGLGGKEAFEYDQTTDALIVDMGKVGDVGKFFEVLNESVEGADIGILSLRHIVKGSARELSEGLANLPCKSLKCLDMGASNKDGLMAELEKEEGWTSLLVKTEALYDPDAYELGKYSTNALSNIACVKAIWIDSYGTMDGENGLGIMSGVEELRFTAGLTSEYRKRNSEVGFTVGDEKRLLDNLKNMKSLKRVVVFPEASAWEADDGYCTFILELQSLDLGLLTNEPFQGWNGQNDSLINVTDIDVLSLSSSDVVVKALKSCLKGKAKSAFETGKSFAVKDGAPKINGKCLVYLGDPTESEWDDYDKFFDYTSLVLLDELKGTNVKTMGSVSNNFDYFVYIYPTFNHVGKYGDSTEAYETEVNVRVYDMNKKEKYESGVIATVPAPDEYRYSGSPASRYWPNIDKEAAIDYIATLV